MKSVFETNLYYAKSERFKWSSGWMTKADAITAAHKFVEDWQENGVALQADVFYRDGSLVTTIRSVEAEKALEKFENRMKQYYERRT